MGMEVLAFESAVAQHEQAAYEQDPSFFDSIRSTAARALAEKIMREASLYRRVDPTEAEKRTNPFAPVRHCWRVGIMCKMSEIEAREKQMDEARRSGLREAAAALRDEAGKYDRVDGPCKWVLMSSLHDAANLLDRMAFE